MAWYEISAYLQAAARWVHVFAAMLWIGQTYLFHFFERNLERDEDADANIVGDLWMVHGGGFYQLEKQRLPELMPRTLHWFKWEAATTWLSGVVLIVLTYYLGGLLVEPDVQSFKVAAFAGGGSIVGGWIVYDVLVRSPLGRSPLAMAVVGLGLLLGLHAGLHEVMSARAAYYHVGAVIGTVMAANVWMRILPSQRKMLAAIEAGATPDPALMATGPLRSKHNSYLVVPLVFLMIANHYPLMSYAHAHSTLMLGVFVLLGWAAAHVMLRR